MAGGLEQPGRDHSKRYLPLRRRFGGRHRARPSGAVGPDGGPARAGESCGRAGSGRTRLDRPRQQGGFSTDGFGLNLARAEANYALRDRIQSELPAYTQGLLTCLATSLRAPILIRADMQAWGLCRDEFQDTGGWPHQIPAAGRSPNSGLGPPAPARRQWKLRLYFCLQFAALGFI